MKKVLLTRGRYASVDEEDYRLVSHYNWYLKIYKNREYAETTTGGRKNRKHIKMHQLILSEKGIDHINGNGLDNRRSNLRKVTQQQNLFNAGLRKDNKSGYRGVNWHASAQKWRSYISLNGKQNHLGLFKNLESAIEARKKAAYFFYGEFAMEHRL